ncbi:MAG TPA: ABC transporter permease [Bryobacteraceae bacterium]|nr:ABC transporter permease [Bryobacteraceae bacterium]
MEGRNAPRICRWVVAAASRIVPRRLRPAWRHRWDNEIWNWWAFLAEHGAFDGDARAQLVRHSWVAFPDAVRTRWGESGARLLAFLRSPALCLAVAALPLLAAAWTGFPGLRAIVEPLPYSRPDRLVLLSHTSRPLSLHNANVVGWRRALRLEGLAAYTAAESRMNGRTLVHGQAEAGFFDLLGTRAALGRLSTEDKSGPPGAVISHALWRQAFGSDPAALGRTIYLDGRPYRIIGVTLPDFWFFRRDVAVWTVLRLPQDAPRGQRFGAVARLKDYARQRDTELELSNIAWQQSPREGVWVQVLPIAERLRFAGRYYVALWIVAVAVALICGMAGFRGNRRSAAFLTAKTSLVVAGLAACAIELPARTATVIAGRAYGVEIWFPIAAGLAVWWGWHDQRRRCRVCLHRLTLPVSFGNWGSPLLDRVGTELVCEHGHGTLYIPGMHWSSSEPERWTNFDDSYNDLFTGQGPPPA